MIAAETKFSSDESGFRYCFGANRITKIKKRKKTLPKKLFTIKYAAQKNKNKCKHKNYRPNS